MFTPLGYLKAQIFLMTPVTFPVWLLGALYFFYWTTGKTFRVLGWAFVAVLVVLTAVHGKDYYGSPMYPMVFAGGAIAFEQMSARQRTEWLKPALVALILVGTLALLPLFLPVPSPEAFLRYQASLPFSIQPDEKSMAMAPMPHYYADCFGWEDMVLAVAKAYAMVAPEERADTAIFVHNFAAAGAVYIIGPKYGLPKVVSGHQNYRLWGPRNGSGQRVIVVGETPEGASQVVRGGDRCCGVAQSVRATVGGPSGAAVSQAEKSGAPARVVAQGEALGLRALNPASLLRLLDDSHQA